jgi:hypothetical protein
LVKRYNQWGPSGLGDRRSQNQGSKPLIEDIEQAQLWQVLQDNSPDGAGRFHSQILAQLKFENGTSVYLARTRIFALAHY